MSDLGWDLPPGTTDADISEAFGQPHPDDEEVADDDTVLEDPVSDDPFDVAEAMGSW